MQKCQHNIVLHFVDFTIRDLTVLFGILRLKKEQNFIHIADIIYALKTDIIQEYITTG